MPQRRLRQKLAGARERHEELQLLAALQVRERALLPDLLKEVPEVADGRDRCVQPGEIVSGSALLVLRNRLLVALGDSAVQSSELLSSRAEQLGLQSVDQVFLAVSLAIREEVRNEV